MGYLRSVAFATAVGAALGAASAAHATFIMDTSCGESKCAAGTEIDSANIVFGAGAINSGNFDIGLVQGDFFGAGAINSGNFDIGLVQGDFSTCDFCTNAGQVNTFGTNVAVSNDGETPKFIIGSANIVFGAGVINSGNFDIGLVQGDFSTCDFCTNAAQVNTFVTNVAVSNDGETPEFIIRSANIVFGAGVVNSGNFDIGLVQGDFSTCDFCANAGQVNTFGTNSIPEPSTWAMMLVGFAGLGFLSYRASRRESASAA